MISKKALAVFKPSAKKVSETLISFPVKMVEGYVPDKVLLLLVNTLDKRIPPKVIDSILYGLERLPPKMRSTIITAADEYVPDSVANSRKVSVVVANVVKYIPNRVIPPESAEEWSSVKTKLHIPTLLSRSRQ